MFVSFPSSLLEGNLTRCAKIFLNVRLERILAKVKFPLEEISFLQSIVVNNMASADVEVIEMLLRDLEQVYAYVKSKKKYPLSPRGVLGGSTRFPSTHILRQMWLYNNKGYTLVQIPILISEHRILETLLDHLEALMSRRTDPKGKGPKEHDLFFYFYFPLVHSLIKNSKYIKELSNLKNIDHHPEKPTRNQISEQYGAYFEQFEIQVVGYHSIIRSIRAATQEATNPEISLLIETTGVKKKPMRSSVPAPSPPTKATTGTLKYIYRVASKRPGLSLTPIDDAKKKKKSTKKKTSAGTSNRSSRARKPKNLRVPAENVQASLQKALTLVTLQDPPRDALFNLLMDTASQVPHMEAMIAAKSATSSKGETDIVKTLRPLSPVVEDNGTSRVSDFTDDIQANIHLESPPLFDIEGGSLPSPELSPEILDFVLNSNPFPENEKA